MTSRAFVATARAACCKYADPLRGAATGQHARPYCKLWDCVTSTDRIRIGARRFRVACPRSHHTLQYTRVRHLLSVLCLLPQACKVHRNVCT